MRVFHAITYRTGIMMMFLIMLISTSVWAQEEGESATEEETTTEVSDSQPASMAMAARRPGEYPPNPFNFYRGNSSTNPKGGGYYFSITKLIFLLAIFFLWTWTVNWSFGDSRSLKVRPHFWASIFLGCGFVGFFLGILSPNYYLMMFLGLLGSAVPIGLYINERNTHVPESGKVLTPRHIRAVCIRTLAKYGIKIGSQEVLDEATGPQITFIGKSKGVDRSKSVESSRGFLAAKELVYDAILRRSTDIHLEPKEGEMSARLRIDGVMYPTEPFDKAVGENIVNIFKVLSAMDITEKRKPQDGSFRAEMDFREIDFRVASQGTRHGEKLVMRILDQSNSVTKLAQLGMRKALQEKLINVISQPHGLFLTCGPTGAGKSTTLYASLGEIDSYQRNIITVEDPIEYKMESVTQIEINNKAGQTFADSLRSILRQDPDVVMIGEIRDKETAIIACQAANTGHMVFSTVHANETFTALYRLLDLGVEPFMLASSLSAILGQRLARRLCSECKVPYKPKSEFLKKVNLPADKIEYFYKPPEQTEAQCPACGGLGFKGRVGVFELLDLNDRMRDMIRDSSAIAQIKAEARKNGMLYMREEGLRLVVRGVTSVDEMLRVVK